MFPVSRSPQRTATQRDYAERIGRVLDHIRANLDATLDLDELANLSHFSAFHFHRVFRGVVGEPVKTHVRRLRLERAARDLRRQGAPRPITELAFDAGYGTPEAFTKAFRQRFGQSPSEFRTSATPLHASVFQPRTVMSNDAPVEIVDLPELTFAKIDHTGPYTEVGPLFERLMGWAGPAGVFGPMTRVFGRFWDDPEVTPADKLRSEVCISVTGTPEVAEGISLATQPAGRFAKHVHAGSYETLGETYGQLLGQWIPALDLALVEGSPCVEIYLNSPTDTAPEDLRTEIYVPLA